MNINKLYSKTALIIKAIAAIILPSLSMIPSLICSGTEILKMIMIIVLISAFIYSLPFIITVVYIRREKVVGIKKFILCDTVTMFLPAFFSVLVIEIADVFINGDNFAAGAFIILFGILFALITFAFWLIYLVNARVNKLK